MKARANVVVDEHDGLPILGACVAEPPFAVRVCGDRVLFAASSAAPVGGDELELEVFVRPRARVAFGSVAAMLFQPGPHGEESKLGTRCIVGQDAHLDWRPEPSISVMKSDHLTLTQVELAQGATARVVEEVSLGRSGEPSGKLSIGLRVTREGKTLLNHLEQFGPEVPGHGSSVSVGPARHVLSAVVVGVEAGKSRVEVTPQCRVAWLPIAEDAAVAFAVGDSRSVVSANVARLVPELISGM